MYFQFLIEDKSTDILVNRVMEKLSNQYAEDEINWNIKSFGGIGHLSKKGSVLERKSGKLLNDLPVYLRAFQYFINAIEKRILYIQKRYRRRWRSER